MKTEIVNFIRQNMGATIAEIQSRFRITYKEAKEAVDELTAKGDLVYAGGVRYNYTGKDAVQEKFKLFDETQSGDKSDIRSRLEARRRELIERMKAEMEDDDDDDDDESTPFTQPADFGEFMNDDLCEAKDEEEYTPLSEEDGEIAKAVADRIKRIVKSDVRMGLKGAVKIAEAILEAVRDTDDYEIILIYERIVYEFKHMSGTDYSQLKREIFTE